MNAPFALLSLNFGHCILNEGTWWLTTILCPALLAATADLTKSRHFLCSLLKSAKVNKSSPYIMRRKSETTRSVKAASSREISDQRVDTMMSVSSMEMTLL